MAITSIKREEFVEYQGRQVPRNHFRAFVYNQTGERLVNSYDEFRMHIDSKQWFETKDAIKAIKRKKVKDDDADSTRVCE